MNLCGEEFPSAAASFSSPVNGGSDIPPNYRRGDEIRQTLFGAAACCAYHGKMKLARLSGNPADFFPGRSLATRRPGATGQLIRPTTSCWAARRSFSTPSRRRGCWSPGLRRIIDALQVTKPNICLPNIATRRLLVRRREASSTAHPRPALPKNFIELASEALSRHGRARSRNGDAQRSVDDVEADEACSSGFLHPFVGLVVDERGLLSQFLLPCPRQPALLLDDDVEARHATCGLSSICMSLIDRKSAWLAMTRAIAHFEADLPATARRSASTRRSRRRHVDRMDELHHQPRWPWSAWKSRTPERMAEISTTTCLAWSGQFCTARRPAPASHRTAATACSGAGQECLDGADQQQQRHTGRK